MAKEKTKNEKLEMYIKENLIDDVDLNLLIGDVAGKLAFDKFNIRFTSPELVLGFYGVVFSTIMEVLLQSIRLTSLMLSRLVILISVMMTKVKRLVDSVHTSIT